MTLKFSYQLHHNADEYAADELVGLWKAHVVAVGALVRRNVRQGSADKR